MHVIKDEIQFMGFVMFVTMILCGWIGYSLHRIARSLKDRGGPR